MGLNNRCSISASISQTGCIGCSTIPRRRKLHGLDRACAGTGRSAVPGGISAAGGAGTHRDGGRADLGGPASLAAGLFELPRGPRRQLRAARRPLRDHGAGNHHGEPEPGPPAPAGGPAFDPAAGLFPGSDEPADDLGAPASLPARAFGPLSLPDGPGRRRDLLRQKNPPDRGRSGAAAGPLQRGPPRERMDHGPAPAPLFGAVRQGDLRKRDDLRLFGPGALSAGGPASGPDGEPRRGGSGDRRSCGGLARI